jgi:hypothetical protein
MISFQFSLLLLYFWVVHANIFAVDFKVWPMLGEDLISPTSMQNLQKLYCQPIVSYASLFCLQKVGSVPSSTDFHACYQICT